MSEVLSFQSRATKATLRDVDGSLVAANQGGCDRWRYKDESLVNVATGRAITMTSASVPSTSSRNGDSQAGRRRLRLVPKDKSFATQKFIIMTSGAIVAKDESFVVSVDEQSRDSRGDQFQSNVSLSPKREKETRFQTFYVLVHFAPEKPLPIANCVPSRMKFLRDAAEEAPLSPDALKIDNQEENNKEFGQRQSLEAGERLPRDTAEIGFQANKQKAKKKKSKSSGVDLGEGNTATQQKQQSPQHQFAEGKASFVDGDEEDEKGGADGGSGDEAMEDKDEERRRKKREKKRRQKEKRKSQQSLDLNKKMKGEEEVERGNNAEEEELTDQDQLDSSARAVALQPPQASSSACSISSSRASTIGGREDDKTMTMTTTTIVSNEVKMALESVLKKNIFHLQSKRNKRFITRNENGELTGEEEKSEASKWIYRSDNRLMNAASGCVLDATPSDARRRLSCRRVADEETPLATADTAAWSLTPNAGVALISGTNKDDDDDADACSRKATVMVLTRKSVLDGGGGGGSIGAEGKGKEEIYVLEKRCDENRATKEKYSQLFKYVVEADNVEDRELALLRQLPLVVIHDVRQKTDRKSVLANSHSEEPLKDDEQQIPSPLLAPRSTPSSASMASTVVSIGSSVGGSSKDRRSAVKLFHQTLLQREFEIQARRSKFPLCFLKEERLQFCRADIAPPASWRYRDYRIQLSTTTSSPTLVIALQYRCADESEVKLESFDWTNPLQEWFVDDIGRFSSRSMPEMMLTTYSQDKKDGARFDLVAIRKEELDPRRKQDQTFNINILLAEGEQDPSREIAFPSRVIFKHRTPLFEIIPPSSTEMEQCNEDTMSTTILTTPLTEVLQPPLNTVMKPLPKKQSNAVRATHLEMKDGPKRSNQFAEDRMQRVFDDQFDAPHPAAVSPAPQHSLGLGAYTSSSATSLSSLGSFQSEASSVIHKRQRRNNFKALLAERDFEILSRKSKFLLSVFAGGKLRFVDRNEGHQAPHRWIFDRNVLRLVTTQSNDYLLSIAQNSGGGLDLFVTSKPSSLGRVDDPLQQWIIEERADLISGKNDPMILFSGVPAKGGCTVILRGATDKLLAEIERSFQDALCVVFKAYSDRRYMLGPGCIDALLSKHLADAARSDQTVGIEKLIFEEISQAMLEIPTVLCENCGLDPASIIAQLKTAAESGSKTTGINLDEKMCSDVEQLGIFESRNVRESALLGAFEAVTVLLRIDGIVTTKPYQRKPDMRNH